MKKILMIVALACAVATLDAQAQQQQPRPGVGGPQSDIEKENAIRAKYGEFQKAWNRHDPKTMAAMWAPDGDHMEPDGTRAAGREEVRALFEKEHTGPFKETKIDLSINSVWFITADVALVDGSYRLTGVRGAGGKALPDREGHLSSILLQENGDWWIAASRAMIPVPLVWREQ